MSFICILYTSNYKIKILTNSIYYSVAWFTFDPLLSPGLQYSSDHATVAADGWEHRVALGSVGFSRGVHYWEFTVERYDTDTDPAFGVARIDVARDKMLGMIILRKMFGFELLMYEII